MADSAAGKKKEGIWETVKTIFWALLIAGIFRTLFFQPFWIPSGSMKDTLLIGDFLFDLQAGSNAGARTVLYAPGALPDYADEADETIRHFAEAVSLLDRL